MADQKIRQETFTKEAYETLPDSFKSLLKPDGDNFVFEFRTAEDSEALANALARERTEKGQFKSKATELETYFNRLGAKPEEIEKIIEDAKKAQEEALKTAGKWDDMKSQLLSEVEAQKINPLTAERDKYKAAAEKFLIEAQLRAAIEKHNPKPGAADVILPHAKQKIRIVEENGELVARVFDGDHPKINVKGEPIGFDDFIEKDFRSHDAFGLLFNPSSNGGGGSQAHTQTNGGSKVAWSSLGNRAKAEAIAKHGTLDEAKKHFA